MLEFLAHLAAIYLAIAFTLHWLNEWANRPIYYGE